MKKDPGIPNLFPYKDKILHEIEESKRRKEEDAQRRREEARARRESEKSGGDDAMADAARAEAEEDDEDLLDYEDMDDEEVAMADAVCAIVAKHMAAC